MLSTLRLDFWLSLWTGLVAAVQQMALAVWLMPVHFAAEQPEQTIMYNLSRSLVLVAAGTIAGVVAVSLRRQFDDSIARQDVDVELYAQIDGAETKVGSATWTPAK